MSEESDESQEEEDENPDADFKQIDSDSLLVVQPLAGGDVHETFVASPEEVSEDHVTDEDSGAHLYSSPQDEAQTMTVQTEPDDDESADDDSEDGDDADQGDEGHDSEGDGGDGTGDGDGGEGIDGGDGDGGGDGGD